MSDTTFQDTPLYAWLRGNAWYLLAGAAIVGGIVTYRNLSTQWSSQAREGSWDSFRALTGVGPDSPALSERLNQAKADSRTYPWFVLESTRVAAQENDKQALALLRPELQMLAKDDAIRVATGGGRASMASFVLAQLDSSGTRPLPQEFNSPEPTGSRVEFVVSVGAESTYTLVAGLYEEQCPLGTAALRAWIEAGRLTGQTARLLGSTGLTMNMQKVEVLEGEAVAPPLLLERPYGLFHEEGMITLMQLPGQFGAQDPNAIQLELMDLFQLDGQATVVAKVVEGLSPLKAALEGAGASAVVTVVSAKAL